MNTNRSSLNWFLTNCSQGYRLNLRILINILPVIMIRSSGPTDLWWLQTWFNIGDTKKTFQNSEMDFCLLICFSFFWRISSLILFWSNFTIGGTDKYCILSRLFLSKIRQSAVKQKRSYFKEKQNYQKSKFKKSGIYYFLK